MGLCFSSRNVGVCKIFHKRRKNPEKVYTNGDEKIQTNNADVEQIQREATVVENGYVAEQHNEENSNETRDKEKIVGSLTDKAIKDVKVTWDILQNQMSKVGIITFIG